MTKKNGIYSEEFKWNVVQEVLSGNLTKEEARRVYSIKGNCNILYWMRSFSGITDYRSGGDVSDNPNHMAQTKRQQNDQKEIARLKQELKAEKNRADLWQKVVEVAEEELGVEIRKKFGARQSPDAINSWGKPSACRMLAGCLATVNKRIINRLIAKKSKLLMSI